MPKPAWSEEWPTEPGWYWFYGWMTAYGKQNFPRTLYPVQAKVGLHGIHLVTGCDFIYRSDAEGWWLPLVPPELPERAKCDK